MEAVKVVEHAHVERRRGGALLFVATHMDVVVTPSPVGQAVNERWVTVKGEDDGLVRREQLVEIAVRETMRVLARWLQFHQVDNIDDADLQIGRMLSKQVDSGKRLQGRHIAATCHHDIGFTASVVACPFPYAESSFAV